MPDRARFIPSRSESEINSGDCVGGQYGLDQRFDYSVLGDAVNLAARLEGQSKNYGVDIVVGEATRALAPGWAMLEIDRVAVVGKTQAVRIHALLGDRAMAQGADFQQLVRGLRRDAVTLSGAGLDRCGGGAGTVSPARCTAMGPLRTLCTPYRMVPGPCARGRLGWGLHCGWSK